MSWYSIPGVVIKSLRVHGDERGRLMELVRTDDTELGNARLAQAYISTLYPGVVKAWHSHTKQTDHFVCLKGMIKLALYDSRTSSPTFGKVSEIIFGDHAPQLVEIPPLVYHGIKCISESEAMVINLPSELYDPKNPDQLRLDPHTSQIPYDWSRKDG